MADGAKKARRKYAKRQLSLSIPLSPSLHQPPATAPSPSAPARPPHCTVHHHKYGTSLLPPYLNDDLAPNGGEASQDSFSGEIFGPLTMKGERGGFGVLRFRECKHVPSPTQDWQTGGSGKTTRPLSTRIAQFGPACWPDA